MDVTSAPPQATHLALEPGEVVDLTIRASVSYLDDDGSATFHFPRSEGDVDHYLKVHLANPNVTVSRSIPADGQPQPGDLWRDRHGKLYAAVMPSSELEETELGVLLKPVDGRGRYAPWEVIHADRLLGPIALEHRPRPTPAQVAEAALTPDAAAVPA
jgi:hypothetical protein